LKQRALKNAKYTQNMLDELDALGMTCSDVSNANPNSISQRNLLNNYGNVECLERNVDYQLQQPHLHCAHQERPAV